MKLIERSVVIESISNNFKMMTIIVSRFFLHNYNPKDYIISEYSIKTFISNKKIKIFIGSWNMNDQNQFNILNQMIVLAYEKKVDVLVLGSQETNYQYFKNKAITSFKEIIGETYFLKSKNRLGKLQISIFLKKEFIGFSSSCENNSILFERSTILKTKGAISLAFIFFGISFIFICSHLTPHQSNLNIRINEIRNSLKKLNSSRLFPLKKSHSGE